MNRVEIAVCPICRQKLALQPYIPVGARVVCANRDCDATLKISHRRPVRVERVPTEETFTADSSPESYG